MECHGTFWYGSEPHCPSGKEHFHPRSSRMGVAQGCRGGLRFLVCGCVWISGAFPTDKLYSFLEQFQLDSCWGPQKCPHKVNCPPPFFFFLISATAESSGNHAISEKCHRAVGEPGCGIRSPGGQYWVFYSLTVCFKLFILLNLRSLTCKNGNNTCPSPWVVTRMK